MVAEYSENSRFTRREDLANAISHLGATLLAVAGLTLMVIFSAIKGDAWYVVSTSVFGTSMVLLYLSSTLAHWMPSGRAKERFFIFDRAAIFILIAGTYTPLALIVLRGPVGWLLFGIEWGLAVFGIIRLLVKSPGFEDGVALTEVIIYALMGWLIVIFTGPVLKSVPLMGYIWIIIGGLFYTFGIIFFKIVRFRYHHLIWHLMVIGGSVSHFTAIFFYMILK